MAELAPRRPSASGPPSAVYDFARRAFLSEDWEVGRDAFMAEYDAGVEPAPLDRLLLQISRIRQGNDPERLAALKPSVIRAADGEAVTRRLLVAPFLQAGQLDLAVAALEKLLEAYPAATDARRQLGTLLARLGRWADAIACVDHLIVDAPEDAALQITRIRYLLIAGRVEEAARAALALGNKPSLSQKESQIVLKALLRGGLHREAGDIAAGLDPACLDNVHLAASATWSLFVGGHGRKAITFAEAAIAAGQDSPALRSHLGKAILTVGRPQDIATKAVEHLSVAVAQTPEDVRANTLLGEALLRTNQHKDAVDALEKAKAGETKSLWTRSLYARGLRAVGRYSESADQYLHLLENQGADRWATHRQAVGVLRQAGRDEEASKIFKAMIDDRSTALSDSFHQALAELPDKLDEAPVRQVCLDWAWTLRADQNDMDRDAWERRARWGALADQLVLDWLECREDQAEEAMSVLADLEPLDSFLGALLAEGKGVIIATAHVGPLFAGPLMLELLGIPSRWVSSTPSIAEAHYAISVISTSDQTDSQVARTCLKALPSNYAVAIAVDSSSRLGAPTTRFEGQDITYTDFAARLTHKAQVPSMFYAPRWEDGRITMTLGHMPSPKPGEELGPFLVRWREAYLRYLREHLAGPPENLRLSGGLWGAIRSGRGQPAPSNVALDTAKSPS